MSPIFSEGQILNLTDPIYVFLILHNANMPSAKVMKQTSGYILLQSAITMLIIHKSNKWETVRLVYIKQLLNKQSTNDRNVMSLDSLPAVTCCPSKPTPDLFDSCPYDKVLKVNSSYPPKMRKLLVSYDVSYMEVVCILRSAKYTTKFFHHLKRYHPNNHAVPRQANFYCFVKAH